MPVKLKQRYLEIFRKKGIEVLLMFDPIDEWVVSSLTEFEGKPLKSIAKGDLELGKLDDEAAKEQVKEAKAEFKELLGRIRKLLDKEIKDVRLSHRLTNSPACLVADEHDMSGNLERILKAVGQKIDAAKPILEINPDHLLVRPVKKIPSNVPAPPMEAIGAPSPRIFPKFKRSAPIKVPKLPATYARGAACRREIRSTTPAVTRGGTKVGSAIPTPGTGCAR